jgi:hypothetical protein
LRRCLRAGPRRGRTGQGASLRAVSTCCPAARRPTIRVYQVLRWPRLRRRFDLLTLTWARSTASQTSAGGEAYHYPSVLPSGPGFRHPGTWELMTALCGAYYYVPIKLGVAFSNFAVMQQGSWPVSPARDPSCRAGWPARRYLRCRGSGSFTVHRRVALIAAGNLWSSAGLYPIYDLCLLMYLPRLETSRALAPPDLMCRHSHGSPRDPRSVKEGMCREEIASA